MYSLEEHASMVCRLFEEVNADEEHVDESYSQEINNCEELEHNSTFNHGQLAR